MYPADEAALLSQYVPTYQPDNIHVDAHSALVTPIVVFYYCMARGAMHSLLEASRDKRNGQSSEAVGPFTCHPLSPHTNGQAFLQARL